MPLLAIHHRGSKQRVTHTLTLQTFRPIHPTLDHHNKRPVCVFDSGASDGETKGETLFLPPILPPSADPLFSAADSEEEATALSPPHTSTSSSAEAPAADTSWSERETLSLPLHLTTCFSKQACQAVTSGRSVSQFAHKRKGETADFVFSFSLSLSVCVRLVSRRSWGCVRLSCRQETQVRMQMRVL